MIVPLPKLGDIVTIESHPYFKNNTEIIISGEHQLTPPLMVIAEILKDNKTLYNEKTGEEESQLGSGQCKCIWFSHKTHQFEEAWLSSKMLKLIIENTSKTLKKEEEITRYYNFVSISEDSRFEVKSKKYKQVVLKTIELELGKKKRSMNYDEGSIIEKQDEKFNINSYMAFVSPVMEIIQVIDLKDTEQKEAKFNSKNGEKRRFTSDWMLKVKWFNPLCDKFSEKILPSCIFNILDSIEDKYLEQAQDLITNLKFIRESIEDGSSTILKPLSISYRSGKYLLKAFDYLLNKKRDIPIINEPLIEEDILMLNTFPKFEFIKNELEDCLRVIDELKNAIDYCIENKNYLRIKYRNSLDKVTWRTIKNISVNSSLFKKGSESYYYFEGYCMTKKEIRTFKTSNVVKMQVLNVNFK